MRMPRSIHKKKSTRSQSRLAETEGGLPSQVARTRAADAVPWAKVPAALLLAAGLWMLVRLMTGASFRVNEVDIRGLRVLPSNKVAEMIDLSGRSVFAVPAPVLAGRIAERYGCIDSVEVRCRLPNQVTVTVREKDVAAVWQSGARYWWLGPDAQVLGETDDPGNLIVVRDVAGMAPAPEVYVPGVPVELVRDLDVVLSANRLYDYTAEEGLVVYVTAEGWPVYLGHDGDAADKVAIMRGLVDSLVSRRAHVEYIDLRNEHRPTYKPG